MDEKMPQKRPSRGSPIGPLILITIGVIFLLNNTGVLPGSGWDLIWRLWPVILILIGFESLWERNGIAGPTFLIGLGVLFLLSNFDRIDWNVWGLAFRLWPILIIAIGLDIVVGKRSLIGSFVALIVMIALLVGAVMLIGPGSPPRVEEIVYPLEGVSEAEITIQPGVGDFRLETLDEGDDLFAATLYLHTGENYASSHRIAGDRAEVSLNRSGVSFTLPSLNQQESDWVVRLNPEVALDLNVDLGVGDARLDLRRLTLASLNAHTGIGRLEIHFSEQTLTAEIDGGIGQTVIYLPRGAAVRLEADTGLSSLSLPAGYAETAEDTYLSPAGKESTPALILRIHQGIGSLLILEEP